MGDRGGRRRASRHDSRRYLSITGLLLVIVVAAAAFGWSQVEIVTVGEREDALTPAWTWLAFLLTFIVAIVGASPTGQRPRMDREGLRAENPERGEQGRIRDV